MSITHSTPASFKASRTRAGAVEVGMEHLLEATSGAARYADCATREDRLALVSYALARTGGRINEAARLIGVHRNTVRERWRELRRSHE